VNSPSPASPAIIYLNGKFVTSDKASISPDDRGFYFADGVYEVIKYYKGQAFCFNDHLARLRNSLSGIRIDNFSPDPLWEIGNRLIELNSLKDKYTGLYIQVTRGVAPRMHRFPGKEIQPTLYVRAFELPAFRSEMQKGITAISREDFRWHRCDIKSIALLANTMLFQEAVEQDAGECFLIRDGFYTEATHSNIIAVMNGTVYTHPDSNLILPGITKKVVLQICRDLAVNFIERPIRAAETLSFDECFITGTGSEIIPVVGIDAHKVGDGRPGAITRKLQNEFCRMTYGELAGEEVFFE